MSVKVYVEADPSGGGVVTRPITADGGPAVPPKAWFEDPGLMEPTPLTVTADGRVFGHIAAWGTRHIGMPGSIVPPKSRSGYAFFKTGVVATDGGDVPVGQITVSGGHAPLNADASAAVKHYDDTQSAVADVAAGEDAHGIWVAGSVRPDCSPSQIRALRASAPSGDWRPINGGLELVAVCQVNVPGFPVARARVASGATMALVAAGASEMYRRKIEQFNGPLAAQVDSLVAAVEALQNEVNTMRKAALRNRVDRSPVVAAFGGDWTPPARQKAASEGHTVPGTTSYPIKDTADLKRAIQAYGRAKDPEATKRHIISEAKRLGATDLLPSDWGVS